MDCTQDTERCVLLTVTGPEQVHGNEMLTVQEWSLDAVLP